MSCQECYEDREKAERPPGEVHRTAIVRLSFSPPYDPTFLSSSSAAGSSMRSARTTNRFGAEPT
jgi:hypothetical protein